jgi:fused signal recognition particle receptor
MVDLFKKFQSGLIKTSNYLSDNILDILKINKIDKDTIDELETILISSDIGLEVTEHLINKIKSLKVSDQKNYNFILKLLASEIENILKLREGNFFEFNDKKPTIFLFIGVNGSGKTTTIGKLLNNIPLNKKILVGACDTFRAAAVEQLKEWTLRNKVDFYQGQPEQDPASVAYNASKKAKKELYDYLVIDTAGRLSNNTNLLNQLVKIKYAISKTIDLENIKTVLVLDGTNGSNMINQVETFGKAMNVNSLIITKIDGTAKGGALISIAKKYEIPIHFVGLGEGVNDLYEFNAKNFSNSMLGIDN